MGVFGFVIIGMFLAFFIYTFFLDVRETHDETSGDQHIPDGD